MRVAVLHPQGIGVAIYRALTPVKAMQRMGVDVDVFYHTGDNKSLFDSEGRLLPWLNRHGREYDLLHCGYMVSTPTVTKLAEIRHRYRIPFTTDIDDDILNVPPYNVAFSAYHKGAMQRQVARMHLRVSDAVSVSTEPLKQALARDCRSITVLPNCIPPGYWEDLPRDPHRAEDKSVRIVVAANVGRYGDVTLLRDALTAILDKYHYVRLFFIGCFPDWAEQWMMHADDPAKNRVFYTSACAADTYPGILSWIGADIFLAPVETNLFNRAKSHIKAFDAAMTGSAFACTDWDTYGTVPPDGAVKVPENKYWFEAIDELVTNAGLRERLRTRLRQWCVDEWHIDLHAQKWVDFFSDTIARGAISSLDEIVRPPSVREATL